MITECWAAILRMKKVVMVKEESSLWKEEEAHSPFESPKRNIILGHTDFSSMRHVSDVLPIFTVCMYFNVYCLKPPFVVIFI